MKRHWIWCVCVTMACAIVGSIELASADEPTGESCPVDCEKGKAERDAICGGLPTQEARQKCLQSSQEVHEKCLQRCSSSDDVEACKRRCDQKASRDHKKCAKMTPGSPEQAKCRQAVEEQRATCYRDCERKEK